MTYDYNIVVQGKMKSIVTLKDDKVFISLEATKNQLSSVIEDLLERFKDIKKNAGVRVVDTTESEISTVNWEKAPEWAMFHAFDQQNVGWWYKAEPSLHLQAGMWEANRSSIDYKYMRLSECLYTAGINWKDSLVKRPDNKEVES